jgi:hypothetical protein
LCHLSKLYFVVVPSAIGPALRLSNEPKQLVEDLRQRSRPPTVALRGARSFFHNELDPRNIWRLHNAEGPKNTFFELVIKNE